MGRRKGPMKGLTKAQARQEQASQEKDHLRPTVPRGLHKIKNSTAANLGFEAQLWAAADALRGSMDAAEYKHVVLGLICLKYISYAFEEQHARLAAERGQGADPEDA